MATRCPSCGGSVEGGQQVCACGWRIGEPSQGRQVAVVLGVGGAVLCLLLALMVWILIVIGGHVAEVLKRSTAAAPVAVTPPTAPEAAAVSPMPPAVVPEVVTTRPAEAPAVPPLAEPAKPPAPPVSETDRWLAQLRDPARGVRQSAAEALQARGWQPENDEQRALVLVAMENPVAAEQYGEAAVEALCLPVNDGGHPYLSEASALSLGQLLDTRAVPTLCKAVSESPLPGVRAAAAAALGRLRDPASLPVLKRVLESETVNAVSERLTAAIQKVQDAAGADRLVAALADDDDKTQLRAAVLLGRKGDPHALAWMREAIDRDDPDLRGRAMELLRQDGSPEAIRILVDRVGGKGYDGPTDAADALVKLGQPAVAPMVAALPDMQHNGRWIMLIGLARIGAPAMTPLAELLPTAPAELKKTACQALGGMGDRDDVPHKPVEPLVALLADPDADVRRYAVHGLELLQWKPEDDAQREQWARARGK